MHRTFQLAAVVLMAAGAGLCDQKAPGKASEKVAPPRNGIVRPNAKKGGGVPKAAPKMGVPNPNGPVQELLRMPPEQRERVIEKFPPAQQEQVRKRLQNFDNLPAAQRERQLRMLDNFSRLSPDKQALVRKQIQAYNELPDDRRSAVRTAYQRLSRMRDEERRAWIASDQFKTRFSPAEQQIVSDLTEYRPLFPER